MRPRTHAERGGFTLLELLVALAAISLIATLAIPAFFARSEVTLDNASRLLAEDLRAAQNRAAFLHVPVRVVFRADGDGYEVIGPGGKRLEAPGEAGEFVRRYAGYGVFDGVRIQSIDRPDRIVRYDQDGRAVDGAAVVVSYQGHARRVLVEQGEGLIRLPDLQRPWIDTGY